jgi:8-oxo-dGTP pyrophosphatase MutT (NUDIX family)
MVRSMATHPSELDAALRERLDALGDWSADAPRRAAVLCLLQERNTKLQLLFVARPHTMPTHPGQIAFPGGGEAAGETPLATALREAREELAIAADSLTVLGQLVPRTSSSGYLVHCIVARLGACELRPDPREVEAVFEEPIQALLDESKWSERAPPAEASGRQPPTSPHYLLGDRWLWGLTARFVRDLTGRWPPA